MAKLIAEFGVMGCGKTSNLMNVYRNYSRQKYKPIVISPSIDSRVKIVDKFNGISIGKITSRSGDFCFGYVTSNGDDIRFLLSNVSKNREGVILVDEVQFFSKDIIDIFSEVVTVNDIPIICYGLRTDYKQELFEGSKRLMEVADEIRQQTDICKCGRRSIFNKRKDTVSSSEQILIGDEDIYYTECRKCHLEKKGL